MNGDVTVLGGGPAGIGAALDLARAGARVTVVDEPCAAQSLRGETLPPEGGPLLSDLKVLSAVGSGAHTRCVGNRSAWGSPVVHANEFIFNPLGSGWLIDRQQFDRSLQSLATNAGARLVCARARAASRSKGVWAVDCVGPSGGATIVAPFVIDCTGRFARFAAWCGVRRRLEDRLVAAVIALPAAPEDRDETVLIESDEQGWWYTARHPRGFRLVTMLTDADIVRRLRTCDGERWFSRRLDETVHIRRLKALRPGQRLVPQLYAAATSRLAQSSGDGWVAAGDSLMTLDPISSYGILSALQFGRRAAAAALGEPRQRSLDEYCAHAADAFRLFMTARDRCYAQELRWSFAPFWRRRHRRAAVGMPAP
jgi:flavin-dependent dehydrogenase